MDRDTPTGRFSVDRLACVDVPALPLQLLLKEHPDWKQAPVAVVAEDRPQSRLLWVNEEASRLGVLPGLRYAIALSLAKDLRAGTVSSDAIQRGVAFLTERLRQYTPAVEPAHPRHQVHEGPGVLWLSAWGLERLYGSLDHWAGKIRADLLHSGFQSTIVVGFTRFGTYAVAKSSRGIRIFSDHRSESAAARRVLLKRLEIEPEVRDALDKLGVRTVGEFLRLPAEEVGQRFGSEAHRWHRLASGDLAIPLQPQAAVEPLERQAELEPPDANTERLLFLVKRMLDSILRELALRGEALRELTLRLALERMGPDRGRVETIRPAAPTLDFSQLLGLIRLRLESLRLQAGIQGITLTAWQTQATQEQLLLFARKPRRDPRAAARAFARLRAEFGDGVVVRARLREAHLPGARFQWEPLQDTSRVASPKRGQGGPRPLVRRIYEKPIPLPPRARREPDGWLLRGLEHGPVQDFIGPYILSGAWWAGGVHREYYFVKMKRGDLFWVYYDRRRRRWFLEGNVE
ncbi:MAG: DNA polymerase Y family protein [Acidobacteriota bacterium]